MVGHATAQAGEVAEVASLLDRAGLYLWRRAEYPQAEQWLKGALAIRETGLGAEHPDTVRSRQQLAAVVAALENRL